MIARTPRIILTSGEPAGIGPDLCIGIAERHWPCKLVIAADRRVLGARAKQLGKTIAIENYDPNRSSTPGSLCVAHFAAPTGVVPGRLDSSNAHYVLELLNFAADGCMSGEFDAMVTAPIQKSVINDAGIAFTGHTEYLAARTQAALPVMMLVADKLRVALATTHISLAQVPAAINAALLEETIIVLERDLKARFNIGAPRILVCGLNPHAGESGHLGREEIDIIAPVVERLRERGLKVSGPAPADTAFAPHMLSKADVVLAMYHDQGLPVLKYAGFGGGVNVTLGLPIVRTSVDHGTALDLAATGKADAGSLSAALTLAIEIVQSHRDTRIAERDRQDQ